MTTLFACATLEFETLIKKAAHLGEIDPYELLPSYAVLAPASHPQLNNLRQLDLEALVETLKNLPEEFFTTPQILIVPRVAAFTHTPLNAGNTIVGMLSDGTLIFEARLGLFSLISLIKKCCIIAYELQKVRELHPLTKINNNFDEQDDKNDDDDDDDDNNDDDDFADDSNNDDDDNIDLFDLTDEPSAEELAATITQLAFNIGVDEALLKQANLDSNGFLLPLLLHEWEMPTILVHADFDNTVSKNIVTKKSERIVATIAEMGLLHREIHLWLGPANITNCVSPYTRELRHPITSWAQANAANILNDVDIQQIDEDSLYALGADFLKTDERLADERANADRTVGIMRHEIDGINFEIIDCGRLDTSVIDERLLDWQSPPEAPVLLRLDHDLGDNYNYGLAHLLSLIGSKLISITIALEVTALSHNPGAIFFPDAVINWAGEQIIQPPKKLSMITLDINEQDIQIINSGSILSVPNAELLSPSHLNELKQNYATHAVAINAANTLHTIVACSLNNTLSPSIELCCAFIATNYLAPGRPDLTTIRSYSALALSKLQSLSYTPPAVPKPAPPSPAPKKPTPSNRAFRLRV
ncbi:MAG: hypothetical protein JW841_09965 [Deltaproteobacteria bacterium]|nr:hypothetical protein [Deltaproteobacteria bacterium]